jgi:uncharacterized protein (DUF1697 family)
MPSPGARRPRAEGTTYLALLRGINVGGKNKVEMARLKETFESIGATEVRTYINSGNVVFRHKQARSRLRGVIESAIESEFGFLVRLVLRSLDEMKSLTEAIPTSWKEDSTMRCYVMFLWEGVDDPAVLDRVTVKEGLDDVIYLPGALVWRVDRKVLTRSGMMRLTSEDLYKQMTIRNVNTVRKLADMMAEG